MAYVKRFLHKYLEYIDMHDKFKKIVSPVKSALNI